MPKLPTTITDHLYDLRDRQDKSVSSRIAELRSLAKIANYLADGLLQEPRHEKAPS